MATKDDYIRYWESQGISFADLVIVVRCKDCKRKELCKDPEYFEYKGANGFCSLGKRKDKAVE